MQPLTEKNKTEECFTALSNLIAEPVVILDKTGKICAVNNMVKEVTGFGAIELVGKSILQIDLLDKENKALLVKNFEKRMKGIELEPYEVKITAKNGENIYFETRGKRIEYCGETVDLVVFHDITERNRIQKQLEHDLNSRCRDLCEIDEKLRSIIDSSPDPIIVFNLNNHLNDCNPAALRAFGYSTKSEIVGKGILEFVAKRDRKRAIKTLENLEKDAIYNVEYMVLTKDGREFPAELSAGVIHDYSKKATGFVAIIKDITGRKKAEEKLRNLAKFPSENPNAVLRITKDGAILYANPAAKVQLSTLEIAVGQPAPLNLRRQIADVLNSGLRKEVEVKCENRILMLTLAPVIEAAYVNVYVFDITERKNMENTLRESEESFRSLINSMDDLVFVLGVDGTFKSYRQPLRKNGLYVPAEQFVGKHFRDVLPPHVTELCQTAMQRLSDSGKSQEFDYYIDINGERMWFNAKLSSIKDQTGRTTSVVTVVRNITERKKTESKLKESEKKYRTLVEKSLQGVLIAQGVPLKLVFANPAMSDMLGYSIDELVSLSPEQITSLIHPHDRVFVWERFRKRLEGKNAPSHYEFRMMKKNGDVCWVEVFCVRVDYNGKPALQATLVETTERKRAEEELQRAEEKFRVIFEGSTTGILAADVKTRQFAFANPQICEITGYPLQELLKLGVKGIHPEKDLPIIIEQFNKQAKGKMGLAKDVPVLRKNGDVVYCDISSKPMRIGGKEYLVGFFRDMTERKQIEEQLKRLKEFGERIIDSLGEALLVIDPDDYTILNANEVALEQLKLRKEELIGTTCYESTHRRSSPCEPPEHICPMREMLETGKPITAEHTHLDRQNNEIYVEVSAYPVKNPEGKTVVIHVAKDVTKRKLVELELKGSEEKFRAISNSVRDAIVLVDQKAKIKYWNPAAEKTFGYTREEALNRNVHDLVIPESMCPEGRQAIERGFEQFTKTGKGAFIDENVELIGRRKDGSEFPVKLSLSPIKLGNDWHAVGVVKDITERKQKEQLAIEYAEKLEETVKARTTELKVANESLLKLERLAAIGELAGMVGHDLRNPLTGIKNATYFLKKKGIKIPETDSKAMLEIIEKGIDHSDKIINDLLDYSREMHLELQQCSLRKLLTETLTLAKVPDNVKIVNNIPDGLGLMVDSNKMERVFINLVKNAIDAMPNGGTIRVSCTPRDGDLEVSFADTGVGVPEEILPKLFSPLFTTKAQGMGFGLAICKRIIEAHGGTIRVDSAKDRGTTFTVTLPFEVERKMENGGEKIWINVPESSLSTMTKA